jgi:hypothetical protein
LRGVRRWKKIMRLKDIDLTKLTVVEIKEQLRKRGLKA